MSPSPPQDSAAENKAQDELEENGQAVGGEAEGAAAETSDAPVKRGRGRPKGSKNKKGSTLAADASGADAPKKKRGRPPKEKKLDEGTDGEPTPKRKRGRPPKNPKPEGEAGATSGGEGGESSEKKKRGRPPKSAASTT